MTICQATICEVVKFLWFKSPEVLWLYSTENSAEGRYVVTIRDAMPEDDVEQKGLNPMRPESLIQSLALLHRILSTSQQCLLGFEAQFSKAVDHVGDLQAKTNLTNFGDTCNAVKTHTSFVSTDQKKVYSVYNDSWYDDIWRYGTPTTAIIHALTYDNYIHLSYTHMCTNSSISIKMSKIDEFDKLPESPAETQGVGG